MRKIIFKIGLLVFLITLIELFLSDNSPLSRFLSSKNQLTHDSELDPNQVAATQSARGLSSLPQPERAKTPDPLNPKSIPPELVSAMIKKLNIPRTSAPRGSSFLNFVNERLRDPEKRHLEKEVQLQNRSFRTLPGVFALPKDALPDSIDRNSQIMNFNRYVVFRTDDSSPPPNSLPVIYNSQSGTIALVTGNLTVVFKGTPTIQPFTNSGLSLIQSFPQVGIATFAATTKDIIQLNQLITGLKQIPNISDISVELTETERVPF